MLQILLRWLKENGYYVFIKNNTPYNLLDEINQLKMYYGQRTVDHEIFNFIENLNREFRVRNVQDSRLIKLISLKWQICFCGHFKRMGKSDFIRYRDLTQVRLCEIEREFRGYNVPPGLECYFLYLSFKTLLK